MKYIKYNSPVRSISVDEELGKVTLDVEVKHSGKSIYTKFNDYDFVIVTVPVPVLKDIEFNPKLSIEKQYAIEKIHMDHCAKLILKFNHKFWKDDMSFLVLPGKIPVFWDTGMRKETQMNLLTGMTSGWKCAYLDQLYKTNRNLFLEVALQDLLMAHGMKDLKDILVDYVWYNWKSNEFIKGGYSYPVVGELEVNWRASLAESHVNKVFFAGEAVAPNWDIQSMHGAQNSGIDNANLVLEKIVKGSHKF